jgi:hypothetical protein
MQSALLRPPSAGMVKCDSLKVDATCDMASLMRMTHEPLDDRPYILSIHCPEDSSLGMRAHLEFPKGGAYYYCAALQDCSSSCIIVFLSLKGTKHTNCHLQIKTIIRATQKIQASSITSEQVHAHNHNDYTVGWVCVLPKEQTAALAMLDEKHGDLPKPQHDNNMYTLGRIRISKHKVTIACLPMGTVGNNKAATVAAHMVSVTIMSCKKKRHLPRLDSEYNLSND